MFVTIVGLTRVFSTRFLMFIRVFTIFQVQNLANGEVELLSFNKCILKSGFMECESVLNVSRKIVESIPIRSPKVHHVSRKSVTCKHVENW